MSLPGVALATCKFLGSMLEQQLTTCSLTFTSGPVNGKKMVVQVTNTGSDLGEDQFNIAIPGGGEGAIRG